MTTSARYWTVSTGLNEYGWFETYDQARVFARWVEGGSIHEYRNVRLIESKEITREEYETLVKASNVVLDPNEYAWNG